MKNKSLKFILRYISTIVLVTLIVIILNYIVIVYSTRYSPYSEEPVKTIKNIAKEMEESNKNLSIETSKMIKNKNLWVQLIDEKGDVIYSNNIPVDIYNHYSLKNIAVASKGYINDYPIFLWEMKESLLILGYPKNSIEKYNWFISLNDSGTITRTVLYIIFFNIGVIVILAIFLVRIFNKPLGKLIRGVFDLKEEKQVCLEEKGIYKDLAASINETSEIILDKNNKIKLRNDAIESWISAISHDIRTPLSMILGYSAMLQEDKSLSHEIHEQTKIISENSIRVRELITNLNLATSLQYNMQPLKLKVIRIGNIAREAVVSCINSGILDKCRCDIIVEDENVAAMIDKKLMLRAIINIITNSSKHSKEGCSIFIKVPKTSDSDPYTNIIISDNGSGISEERLAVINREINFNNSIDENHGLGLIIVKSIIKAHNGKFTIENNKDKGITVILKISKIKN